MPPVGAGGRWVFYEENEPMSTETTPTEIASGDEPTACRHGNAFCPRVDGENEAVRTDFLPCFECYSTSDLPSEQSTVTLNSATPEGMGL